MKITLCGSTRFREQFEQWNRALTIAGHVVYSVGMFGREADDTGKEGLDLVGKADKRNLDLVHLAKIEESDAIVVLNVGDYVGESTSREIAWALLRGKHVYVAEATVHVPARGLAMLLIGSSPWLG